MICKYSVQVYRLFTLIILIKYLRQNWFRDQTRLGRQRLQEDCICIGDICKRIPIQKTHISYAQLFNTYDMHYLHKHNPLHLNCIGCIRDCTYKIYEISHIINQCTHIIYDMHLHSCFCVLSCSCIILYTVSLDK